MRPILFSVRVGGGVLRFPSYGALVALGFVLGIALFVRSGRRQGFDPGRLQDLAFSSVVLGLVGARLGFVLLNARAFLDACWPGAAPALGAADHWVQGGCFGPLRFWDGGLVFYGGAVAVAGVVWFTCRREGWAFLRLGDLAAPSVALGHAVGRLGCWMAGCCYGKPCAAPWAMRFGPGSVAFDEWLAAGRFPPTSTSTSTFAWTPPLHPTQLYEAIGELAIFVGLVLFERRRTGGPAGRALGRSAAPEIPGPAARAPASAGPAAPAPGHLLGGYVLAYAALRFGVEVFRGDVSRGYLVRCPSPGLASALGLGPHELLFLSTSQAVSLLLVAAVAFGFARSRLRRRASRNIRR